MGISAKENLKALFDVADGQEGYFTTKQAKQAGYSDASIVYHVKNGDWIKEWRGIYKLSHYPSESFDNYLVWYLWSSDRSGEPQGTYSYDTALSIHDLSTWADSKTHMTVPCKFRRTAEMPKVLQLHYADLKSHEVLILNHVRVTTPLKTLTDLLITMFAARINQEK
jgi:predicted transcriptional regulator of viral defense system